MIDVKCEYFIDHECRNPDCLMWWCHANIKNQEVRKEDDDKKE
jgi:hypothetical protein